MGQKNWHRFSVAGFTIRSLTPVVTTLGYQFIASTTEGISSTFGAISSRSIRECLVRFPRVISFVHQSKAHTVVGWKSSCPAVTLSSFDCHRMAPITVRAKWGE
jgi:hypothetical protein